METPNRNSSRLWKWISGVLGGLLTVSIIGTISTIRQIEHLQTTQLLMNQAVGVNAQWIRDWSAVLKVPERDQRQDSAIKELERRLDMLEQQIREK